MTDSANNNSPDFSPSPEFVQEVLKRQLNFGDGQALREIKTFTLSTTKDLVLTQTSSSHPERVYRVPSEGGVEVIGDKIRIVGSISIPSGFFRIFCRELEIVSLDGKAVTINVSGDQGKDATKTIENKNALIPPPSAPKGKPGKGLTKANASEFNGVAGGHGDPGQPAGAIVIQAESLMATTAIKLVANGGLGGNAASGGKGCFGQQGANGWWKKIGSNVGADGFELGQPGGAGGHGGEGGHGGAGGDAGIVICHILTCSMQDKVIISAVGGTGGVGGAGGNGGKGGSGGNGTQNFGHFYEGGDAGTGGDAGKPGTGGIGGAGGLVVVPDCLKVDSRIGFTNTLGGGGEPGAIGQPGEHGLPGKGEENNSWKTPAHPKWIKDGPNFTTLYPPENYGPNGGLKAADGKPANAGKSVKRLDRAKDGTAGKVVELRKIANRSDFITIPCSPVTGLLPSYQTVLGQLRLLIEHCSLVHLMADLTKDDNSGLKSALNWIADLSNGIAGSKRTLSIQGEANALAMMAQAALTRVETKQDYFGKNYYWVPLRTIKELHRTLSESLNLYQLVDKNSIEQAEKLRNVSEKLKDAQSLSIFYKKEIEVLEGLIKHQQSQLKPKAKIIYDDDKQLDKNRRRIIPQLEKLEKEVHTVFKNVSPERLISAIGSLAFIETPGMGALLGSAALADQVGEIRSWVNSGIESSSGQLYDEKLIVSKVNHLGRGLDNLKQGFQQALDGTISIDDPNGQRLLSYKADFDNLCQEFYEISEATVKAQIDLDKYIESVQIRNGHIAEYNALVIGLVEQTAKLKAVKTELGSMEQGLTATAEPFLASREAGIARRRRAALQIIVKELYQAGRAIMFWKLEKFDAFAASDIGIGFDSFEIESLHTKMIRLLESIGEIEDYTFKYTPPKEDEHWIGAAQKGVLVPFDRDDIDFESLLNGETVRINIPVPTGNDDDSLDPFCNMAASRVLELRAWLQSKEKLLAQVHFTITRLDSDDFIDKRKGSIIVNHDFVRDEFIYEKGLPRYLTGEKDADEASVINRHWGHWLDKFNELDHIAPIGPFGGWDIQLPTDHNLDLLEEIKSKGGQEIISELTLEFRCIYEPFDVG